MFIKIGFKNDTAKALAGLVLCLIIGFIGIVGYNEVTYAQEHRDEARAEQVRQGNDMIAIDGVVTYFYLPNTFAGRSAGVAIKIAVMIVFLAIGLFLMGDVLVAMACTMILLGKFVDAVDGIGEKKEKKEKRGKAA